MASRARIATMPMTIRTSISVKPPASDRNRRLDGGMRLIGFEREVLVLEVEEFFHRGIELHDREGSRRALHLLAGLLQVIQVEVRVAERQHKLARLQVRHLRHHQGEYGVGGDVEGHAEE